MGSCKWAGDEWAEPEGAGDIELPYSDEFILPEVAKSPPLAMTVASLLLPSVALPSPPSLEETNPTLPVETVKIFHDSVAQHENTDTPQDLPSPPTFASRPITRSKSKKAP